MVSTTRIRRISRLMMMGRRALVWFGCFHFRFHHIRNRIVCWLVGTSASAFHSHRTAPCDIQTSLCEVVCEWIVRLWKTICGLELYYVFMLCLRGGAFVVWAKLSNLSLSLTPPMSVDIVSGGILNGPFEVKVVPRMYSLNHLHHGGDICI